ncbi:GntR family transcriptional regulator [Qiania dongpingensis]|uniref:GntR family transcriptional regulator n=1 Tax=Qiania dongpingensis TaxID=2763669 RepID=A0A7G9G1X9_9FIRM|nr:GntR family transcriptional regulator [Qiania dongpingensis]QNM04811.1 GntR family transcriptional regulator [Qiania dongpingensis]
MGRQSEKINKSNGLCRLVYDYYETRIRFGFYKFGDSLPPISQICTVFHLGRATVRSALAMLEKEGYIRNEERKAAAVIFQADFSLFGENAAKYYVPRKEGILDFNESGRLLIVPLWERALQSWGEERWRQILQDLDAVISDDVPLTVKFYMNVLSTWDNQLILSLFWEGIRYLRFPYLSGRDEPRITVQELEGVLRKDSVSFLKQEFERSYNEMVQGLFSFIEQASVRYQLMDVEPVPFRWNIHRQPQIRHILASQIIREIMGGTYPVGSYLPSLPRMKERYGVSLTTVRRVLSLLETFGVTKSFQGKGTQVCMEPRELDLSRTEIRESLKLYRESLQLLAMTVRDVSLYTLGHTTEEKLTELQAGMSRIFRKKRSYLCFDVYLTFLIKECPLAMVRECYKKLAELVVWGCPFTLLQLRTENLDTIYSESAVRMAGYLEDRDLEAFSEEWRELLEREEKRCPPSAG